VLRVVRFVATVRDESIARRLLLRFTICDAITTVGVGISYAVVFLSPRRGRAGLWMMRLAVAIMKVAAWVRPDFNGPSSTGCRAGGVRVGSAWSRLLMRAIGVRLSILTTDAQARICFHKPARS
jgi:hypothetical protein